MDVQVFWRAVLEQDAAAMREFFHSDAVIRWHCTNEQFDLDSFLIANCEYPGDWDGRVERVEEMADGLATVVRVYPKDRSASFHVTSFLRMRDGRIAALDEYWADDGEAPQWRRDRRLARPINDVSVSIQGGDIA